MLVLGLGGFMHDYNAALIDTATGRVAMAEAERASRRKHHTIQAGEDLMAPIETCCAALGVKAKHIEAVVFGHADHFACKDAFRKLFPKARFADIDHHRAHAAGGFFASGFDEALVVSLDGFGDGASCLIAHGRGNTLTELSRTDDKNSFGLEYLRATFHLGLGGYGSEGKTQGLAPYGKPVLFDAYMRHIAVDESGHIVLAPELQSTSSDLAVEGGYLNTQILTNAFLDELGPRRIDPEPMTDAHNDLAASIQKVLEEVLVRLCAWGKAKTGCDTLVLSGGVSMNSSANGEILKQGMFKRIFALPMASDRGIALGAALAFIHQDLGLPRFFALDHVFYGGACEDKAAEKAMKKAGLTPRRVADPYEEAAQTLAKGGIVGWVQGRSELGARALGHRSIVADPRRAEMKDIINHRVKHREWFRPFAPAVLAERAHDYFTFPEGVADLSMMTFTVEATALAAQQAPATVHVDNTARVQVVDGRTNPEFHRLIGRFAELTGVPVVLNTSFNDKGEPIVETAEDAVRTFMNADMDLLIIGNVVAESVRKG
ncbi:MAG: carbamoyl transferase [Magnetospirillum sp.]|nr:carbamoyl transferase [Magnetospirillum sp.]